ncbi:MAG: hypothetical protein M1834_002971 [Cirrosporium novae-zelandiae]|nr:MAG: hypothetical protein M1834_002971 [Cirrosporium novae-zelandiae]
MLSKAATRTFRFLTANQIQHLHARQVVEGGHPIQPALLESAVSSPMNVNHYTQTDNTFTLAAILSKKIIKNHAFQDGNKRTALVAAAMFLRINGYRLQETLLAQASVNADLATAHAAVCTNQCTVEELAEFYSRIVAAVPKLSEGVV